MLPAAPMYQNIYNLSLSFPVLDSIALVVIGFFLLVLGALLIEQNAELSIEKVKFFFEENFSRSLN